jgi:flagellin
MTFQIGANEDQILGVEIQNMSADAIGVSTASITVSSHTYASDAISALDVALETVAQERATLGSYINRLEHTINNLNVQRENMSSSESRIRDLDMAAEVSNLTRSQILAQSSQAMLAQANATPQSVLSLLR